MCSSDLDKFNEDTLAITVDSTVYADAGIDRQLCIDSGLIQLNGLPLSGNWSGPGMN